MKNFILLILSFFITQIAQAQPAQIDFKIFGKVYYTDKTPVADWDVKIINGSGLEVIVKTDKNGAYATFVKVDKDSLTIFEVITRDPCATSAVSRKTEYNGRSQSSGPIDFIICKSNTGSGACPVKFTFTTAADGTVVFTAEPDYPGAEYSWKFGDGLTDVGKTVKHKYARNGAYEVTVTVKLPNCTSSNVQKIVINSNPNPPNPNYSTNASCCGKLNVKAITSSSTTGYNFKFVATADYKINEVTWDFGDGKTGTGIEVEHQYDSLGTYKVKARIVGDNCVIEMNMTVQVTDRKVSNGNPCAFDFNYTVDRAGLVTFTSKFGTKYEKLSWEFGDGTSSTDENPTHQYTKAGEYKVSLTAVINGVPCTLTKVIKISNVANNPCPNDFEVKLDSLTASFSFVSTTKPDSVYWFFGDSSTSNEINPKHTYAKAGTYPVLLVLYFNGVPCRLVKPIKLGNVRGSTVEISIKEVNPNPAASDLTVTVKSNGAYTVDLHIADVTGGAIQKHTLNLVDGENKVPLMVDSLQVGVYYIIIYHNGTPVTKATFQKI